MPVTEIALLRLQPGYTLTTPSLLYGLRHTKFALETFTKQPFEFYRIINDGCSIYLVGGWDTPEHHWVEYRSTPAYDVVFELLKDQVRIEFMYHVDTPVESLPMHDTELEICRLCLTPQARADHFQVDFGELLSGLKKEAAQGRVGGGRRIEVRDDGKEEFVVCRSPALLPSPIVMDRSFDLVSTHTVHKVDLSADVESGPCTTTS